MGVLDTKARVVGASQGIDPATVASILRALALAYECFRARDLPRAMQRLARPLLVQRLIARGIVRRHVGAGRADAVTDALVRMGANLDRQALAAMLDEAM